MRTTVCLTQRNIVERIGSCRAVLEIYNDDCVLHAGVRVQIHVSKFMSFHDRQVPSQRLCISSSLPRLLVQNVKHMVCTV